NNTTLAGFGSSRSRSAMIEVAPRANEKPAEWCYMKLLTTFAAVGAIVLSAGAGRAESPAPPRSAAPDLGWREDVDAWIGRLTGADASSRRTAVAAADTATAAQLP